MHLPEEIKLPAYSISPSFLRTGADSPVKSASLTSTLPSATMQSAGIWSPRASSTTSSSTMSFAGISAILPSRSTCAMGAVRMERRSILNFAITSVTMPKPRLSAKMATNKNCEIGACE